MKSAAALLDIPSPPGFERESLEGFGKRHVREREEKLMLAILEDGIACYQKYADARDRRGKILFREAEQWILEEKSDWIFSFENVCEVLGLAPKYVRQGLLRWKERTVSSPPKAEVLHLPYKGKGRRRPQSGS